MEEEQSAVAETSADEQGETVVGESAEETPPTDERMVTNEEETPVVESRVLRSGGKTATPKSKTTKDQQEENEQERTSVEKSADTDKPAAETGVLRRGRKSGGVTDLDD